MTTPTLPVAPDWHVLSTLPARPRLLVVDDQPINIQTLYQIFHADHEVFMATSGEQALAFCRGNSLPDLILLDVVMPDLDGVAVCQQLKADPVLAHIPVIFVTACMDPADETVRWRPAGWTLLPNPSIRWWCARVSKPISHSKRRGIFCVLWCLSMGSRGWPIAVASTRLC